MTYGVASVGCATGLASFNHVLRVDGGFMRFILMITMMLNTYIHLVIWMTTGILFISDWRMIMKIELDIAEYGSLTVGRNIAGQYSLEFTDIEEEEGAISPLVVLSEKEFDGLILVMNFVRSTA